MKFLCCYRIQLQADVDLEQLADLMDVAEEEHDAYLQWVMDQAASPPIELQNDLKAAEDMIEKLRAENQVHKFSNMCFDADFLYDGGYLVQT